MEYQGAERKVDAAIPWRTEHFLSRWALGAELRGKIRMGAQISPVAVGAQDLRGCEQLQAQRKARMAY